MTYTCPVCGYSQMPGPPENYTICPSCGTQFGYDDASRSHRTLRNEWLLSGAPWFSSFTHPDVLWNGFRQVYESGLPFDVPAPAVDYEWIVVPVRGPKDYSLQVQMS
jgi:hypothetical protein